ncbi:hypothetical protein Goshw_008746 [Gossypium schwendimanii]|uniref:Zinc knuckle CX2CX4HX4C domain-containing protein n=1 Tax=Gossypium schwendimanii TaxID=34291 RepID=A0A7J9MGF8_GOSSC|nr:hypothetical protein [Gossypium schwendimanii]
MEESIAGLPIGDEEEETILLGVESSDQKKFYANCFVGIFLTSSVVNFQAMRTMLENDWHPNGGVSILDLGDEARSPGACVYVHFEYEKLTLFCFPSGKLGHGKSFCLIRALHLRQEYEFQWDISLRAQPIKNTAWRSRWLVEDDAGRISNYGNSTNKSERSNLGISQPVPMNQ